MVIRVKMFSEEQTYDSCLRVYLDMADRDKRASQFSNYGNKLDNYQKARDRLNQFYDLITRIQIDGLFDVNRATMARKGINLLTEIVNIEGEKLLKNFILN